MGTTRLPKKSVPNPWIVLLQCAAFAGQSLLLPAYADEVFSAGPFSASGGTLKAEEAKKDELANENLTVEDVTIEGNRLVPTDHILNVVKTRRGDKFDREQVVRDLKAVNNLGYFDDRSLQAVPELGGSGVLLKIRVQENAPVTEFAFQGNSVLSNDELSKLFSDQLGKPQNLAQLSQAIDKVEQLYHEKGFTLARVVDVKDDPDGSVHLNIDEGVINSIQVTGNRKTKDFIIRNAIKTKAGSVYNEKQLTSDLRQLFANGYFQDIRRSLSPSAASPDKYDLKVEVDEKRTGSIGLGGGVDTIAGPFGSFSFSDSNFRGRGQIVSFNSQMGSGVFNQLSSNLNNGGTSFVPNARNFQLEASFVEPNFRGTNTALSVNAFGRNMGSFMVDDAVQKTLGASVNFSKPLKGHWSANLGLLGENTSLRNYENLGLNSFLTQRAMQLGYATSNAGALAVAQNIRDQQLKGGTYFGISPSLVYDTRDPHGAMWDPRKGTMAKLTASPNIGLSGSSFFKLGASASKYVPVTKNTTLAFNVQGGTGVGGIPQFAGYRLGGFNGIRGYRMFSDLGTGTGLLMATAELRMKLPLPQASASSGKVGAFVNSLQKNVRPVIFADAGGVTGNGLINNFYNRGTLGGSVGFGLRMNVPYLGLIRLDYGMPLLSVAGGSLIPRMTVGFGDKF